jgi:hypothetical protein
MSLLFGLIMCWILSMILLADVYMEAYEWC